MSAPGVKVTDIPKGQTSNLNHLTPKTLAQAAQGQREAQTAVLEATYEFVRPMLIRLVGPITDVDDLKQTTLLKVLQGLPKFDGRSSFKTWVATICVNVAKNFYRGRSRTPVSVDPTIEVDDPAAGDMHSAAEARQALALHLRALDTLSEKHRTVYVLKVLDGYSIDEIAAITQSARSTTRLRLYYARKAMFKAVRALGGDWTEEPSP